MRAAAKQLGITIHDIALLTEALTHRSYVNENPGAGGDNERLEFLGDAVLGLVINEYLFRRFPDRPEGVLAKIKSVLVSDVTLAGIAEEIGLGGHLLLGLGEERSGGRTRKANLENTLEAVIGAVYLDGGLPRAAAFIHRIFSPHFERILGDDFYLDYKTLLQERVQQHMKMTPQYTVLEEHGPEHKKEFIVEVTVNGKRIARGSGLSKKSAEQTAAREALTHIPEKKKGR